MTDIKSESGDVMDAQADNNDIQNVAEDKHLGLVEDSHRDKISQDDSESSSIIGAEIVDKEALIASCETMPILDSGVISKEQENLHLSDHGDKNEVDPESENISEHENVQVSAVQGDLVKRVEDTGKTNVDIESSEQPSGVGGDQSDEGHQMELESKKGKDVDEVPDLIDHAESEIVPSVTEATKEDFDLLESESESIVPGDKQEEGGAEVGSEEEIGAMQLATSLLEESANSPTDGEVRLLESKNAALDQKYDDTDHQEKDIVKLNQEVDVDALQTTALEESVTTPKLDAGLSESENVALVLDLDSTDKQQVGIDIGKIGQEDVICELEDGVIADEAMTKPLPSSVTDLEQQEKAVDSETSEASSGTSWEFVGRDTSDSPIHFVPSEATTSDIQVEVKEESDQCLSIDTVTPEEESKQMEIPAAADTEMETVTSKESTNVMDLLGESQVETDIPVAIERLHEQLVETSAPVDQGDVEGLMELEVAFGQVDASRCESETETRAVTEVDNLIGEEIPTTEGVPDIVDKPEYLEEDIPQDAKEEALTIGDQAADIVQDKRDVHGEDSVHEQISIEPHEHLPVSSESEDLQVSPDDSEVPAADHADETVDVSACVDEGISEAPLDTSESDEMLHPQNVNENVVTESSSELGLSEDLNKQECKGIYKETDIDLLSSDIKEEDSESDQITPKTPERTDEQNIPVDLPAEKELVPEAIIEDSNGDEFEQELSLSLELDVEESLEQLECALVEQHDPDLDVGEQEVKEELLEDRYKEYVNRNVGGLAELEVAKQEPIQQEIVHKEESVPETYLEPVEPISKDLGVLAEPEVIKEEAMQQEIVHKEESVPETYREPVEPISKGLGVLAEPEGKKEPVQQEIVHKEEGVRETYLEPVENISKDLGVLVESEVIKEEAMQQEIVHKEESVHETHLEPVEPISKDLGVLAEPEGIKEESVRETHLEPVSKEEDLPVGRPVEEDTVLHEVPEPSSVGSVAKDAPVSQGDTEKPHSLVSEDSSAVDFREQVKLKIVELVYWRDVKKSAIVFSSLMLFLISLATYSVLSVAAYMSLAFLTVTLSFRIYKNVLQAVQKSSDGHPFKQYLSMDISIPSEKVHQFADNLNKHLTCTVKELRRLFLVEDLVDSVKFGLLLWVMTYIGAWFNGMTLIILGVVGVFTFPKVYETYQVQIDQYLDIARTQIRQVMKIIQEKVPFPGKKKTQ